MMPGMGRMNPRMMKKLQKQLQSATEEIDATEVIIRTKDKELYFSNPSVSAMNMMGQQSYQICLLYTSPSPRDATLSRMPSSA